MKKVDIVIIVPKADELNAVEVAFEKKFQKSSGILPGNKFFYIFDLEILSPGFTSIIKIAVVFLNDQGNVITSSITEQIYSELNPPLAFMVGTAVGKKGKVKIGDVVVSSKIVDCQEAKVALKVLIRPRHHDIQENVLIDINRFLTSDFNIDEFFIDFKQKVLKLNISHDLINQIWKKSPIFDINFIASSSNLQLNPERLQEIWDVDDRISVIDMESGGFGQVAKRFSTSQWLVFRGISDYGTEESKKSEFRTPTALIAALFLKYFIINGLKESHPNWINVPLSERSELSLDSLYSKYDTVSLIKKEIKTKLNIDLSQIDFNNTASLEDIIAICVSYGADRERSYELLLNFRENYFTNKYYDYTYEQDLRGILPGWSNEIMYILQQLDIDLKNSIILDVGIGNGLEAPYLFQDVNELHCVDISQKMLEKAKENFPKMITYNSSAEDLNLISTESIDLYVSLRTFQSSFFNITLALREAQRVLKKRGHVLLSIANGFVEFENNEKRIVRGLLIPGSQNLVDKNRPILLKDQILSKLRDLGFKSEGFMSNKTDIYIWAEKS